MNSFIVRGAWFSPLVFLFSLAACGSKIDLDAVRTYAKTTAAASASFDTLANDYYGTCVRRREYRSRVSVGGSNFASPLLERPATSTQSSSAPPPKVKLTGDADCRDSASLSERWRMENDVLVGYVRALGEVAGVDTAPKNFDTLASSLKSAGLIKNDATAKAGGDLASAIVSSLIRAKQEHSIVMLVDAASAAGFDNFVDGLPAVAQSYQTNLKAERTDLNAFYTTTLSNENDEFALLDCPYESRPPRAHHAPVPYETLNCARFVRLINRARRGPARNIRGDPVTRIVQMARISELHVAMEDQRRQWSALRDAIDAKSDAATIYVSSIQLIKKTQDTLITQPRPGLLGLVDAVKPYVDELGDKVTALSEALKK